MKTNKRNLIIYIIALVLSGLCIGLYFIEPNNPGCILSCSVGASGIGAVLLGYFLERANNINKEKSLLKNRKDILYPIFLILRTSICQHIKLLSDIGYTIKSATVKEFFNEFNELAQDYILEKKGFWDTVNMPEYVKKIKKIYSRAPISSNAIIEINNNRSLLINSGVLTSDEIQDLLLIEIFIGKIESAIDIDDILAYLRNLFSYIHFEEIKNIAIQQNENEVSFYYNDQKIYLIV